MKKIPAIEIRFPLHFFLSASLDCFDARSRAALADEIDSKSANIEAKLFRNCKFRMVFVALIPVVNYNAQIAFKKRIANGDLWLCTRQHERTRSRLAGSRVEGCRLRQGIQGESFRCKGRPRRTGQAGKTA